MQTSLQPLGFVNPVRNKTKAIKPVFQRWSPLSQLLTVPDFSPCVRPPALWYLFRCIYGSPGRGPRTVSATDVAKSKIPFRDLFYLKSTPLMGLMAFQSLSMHCQ